MGGDEKQKKNSPATRLLRAFTPKHTYILVSTHTRRMHWSCVRMCPYTHSCIHTQCLYARMHAYAPIYTYAQSRPPHTMVREGFYLVHVSPPVRFEGEKTAFFLEGRFLIIFGRLPFRRCVSLRFHFLAPAHPSISATLSWREPKKWLSSCADIKHIWTRTGTHQLHFHCTHLLAHAHTRMPYALFMFMCASVPIRVCK